MIDSYSRSQQRHNTTTSHCHRIKYPYLLQVVLHNLSNSWLTDIKCSKSTTTSTKRRKKKSATLHIAYGWDAYASLIQRMTVNGGEKEGRWREWPGEEFCAPFFPCGPTECVQQCSVVSHSCFWSYTLLYRLASPRIVVTPAHSWSSQFLHHLTWIFLLLS